MDREVQKLGAFTVVYRGRFRVLPEDADPAATLEALSQTLDALGFPNTPAASADRFHALDVARHKSRYSGGGLVVRFDPTPFNPVTEVTDIRSI